MANSPEHLYSAVSHPDGLGQSKIWHDIVTVGESINLSDIRTQEVQGKPVERWGVIEIEGLPFFFRGWKSGERTISVVESSRIKTTWYPHAPYHPEAFSPPQGSEPLSPSDMGGILEKLGVPAETIEKASKDGTTKTVLHESLAAKKDEYQTFETKRKSDPLFREVIGAAISLACEEVDKISPKA